MRRPTTALVLAVTALALAAAQAQATAFAPPDRPGPGLSVPAATLAAALECRPSVDHATRAPVLLVPGTGSTPPDNFGWNYEPAFDRLGIPWCAITLPQSANGDIQVAGEYVVYAIRTEARRAGRRIAVIGHSQGGMVPRWALRFWPDTRALVDDMIGFAPTNHGTTQAQYVCRNGCSPADYQQQNTSNFIAALNSYQETFPGISYTDVYTHTDEEVQPNADDHGSSSLHGGGGAISNVAVQDICPNDTTEHLGLGTYDPVAYALAIDALDHTGPADPARIDRSVCTQQFMPGVSGATIATNGIKALVDDETSPSDTVTTEPPLRCYVTDSCPRPSSGAGLLPAPPRSGCIDRRYFGFRLHAPLRARIVSVDVFVNRARIARFRGRDLRTLALRRLPRGNFVLRISTRASDGTRRVSERRYKGCSQTKPRTRTQRPRRRR